MIDPRYHRSALIILAVAVLLVAAAVAGWLLAARTPEKPRVMSSPLPPIQVLPQEATNSHFLFDDETAEELPVRGNLPRYLRNAHPTAEAATDMPVIAVILDDVGVHVENSENALSLPAEITFAFLPYGRGTADQAHRAKAKGHEIMVHIPMQPLPHKDGKAADPGPLALTLNHTADELVELTRMNIENLLPYAVGANNHMGSAFTASKAGMRAVLEVLNEETLLFVDSLTTPDSTAHTAAQGLDLPILVRDTFLDHENSRRFIDKALAQTERIAAEKGYAIAIGHPYPNTVAALKDWVKTLKQKNIRIVPISHVVQYAHTPK